MTIPRYEVICAHWRQVPPLSISVAAIARWAGAMQAPSAAPMAKGDDKASQRQALIDMLGAGGTGFKTEKPKWLKEAEAATTSK